MIYAKLCYSPLLFRSPRKSNYVVVQGSKWCVDWTTGRMVRVLPPGYFDSEAAVTNWGQKDWVKT
ncbi:PH domain-containing protein [Apiospora rasikravindrae]|uniref:PH domain-containing protein n=1 Tax=Apiospora rasikravindrae TaxID=990691 RepID=A0ABR1SKA7_9PEZI